MGCLSDNLEGQVKMETGTSQAVGIAGTKHEGRRVPCVSGSESIGR